MIGIEATLGRVDLLCALFINAGWLLLSLYYVPDTGLSTFKWSISLGLHNNLMKGIWYPHFTDKETSRRQNHLPEVVLRICTQSWGFQPGLCDCKACPPDHWPLRLAQSVAACLGVIVDSCNLKVTDCCNPNSSVFLSVLLFMTCISFLQQCPTNWVP